MEMGTWQPRNASPKWLEGTPGGLWQTQVPEEGSQAQKSRRDRHLENSQLPRASYPGAFGCPRDTSTCQAFPWSAQSPCSAHVPRLLLTSSSSLRCHLTPLPFRALSSSGPGVTSTSGASCCLSGPSSLISWISSTWASYSCHSDSPQSMCEANAISETKGLKFVAAKLRSLCKLQETPPRPLTVTAVP